LLMMITVTIGCLITIVSVVTISLKAGSVSTTGGTTKVKHGQENIQNQVTSFSISVRRISRFIGNVTVRISKNETSKVKFERRSMNVIKEKAAFNTKLFQKTED
jgi:hypothetical protein